VTELRPGELRDRVIRSFGWTAVRVATMALLQAATLMILFRLLEPEEFGAISVVTVVLCIAQALTHTGVDLALVREPGDIRRYLDPFWSLQVVRGLVLGGAVAALAVPISLWQGSPRLADYLLVSSLVPVFEGLRGVSPILFNRALEQRRAVVVDVICAAISFATLISLALRLRSPWAVVWSQVVSTLVRSVAYTVASPVRARFTLAWGPLRRFWRFGIGYNLAQSSRYLVDTVDRLLIGRQLGMHTLGLYDRSHVLAHYGLSQLPAFFATVVFPAFSRVRGDPARFRRLARRFLLVGSLAGCSVAGLVRLLDESLLAIVAGERAAEILPFFRILLVLALLRGIALLGHVLLDVVGRPQVQAAANGAQVLWLLVALPVAVGSGELAIVCVAAVAGGALNALLTTLALARAGRVREREAIPAPAPAPDEAVAEPAATA